jgi:galactose mutarotase-like enzyme
MSSLFIKEEKREYLWQPGEEIWNAQPMLLFPNAGRIKNGKIIAGGNEYPLMMHGFARRMEFQLVRQDTADLILELHSSAETKRFFPYGFILTVEYHLRSNGLDQLFKIRNSGEGIMWFGFGVHPGFYCPIAAGEESKDYVLRFDSPQTLRKIVLDEHTKLSTRKRIPFLDRGLEIPLGPDFFNRGPIVSEGYTTSTIKFLSKKSGRFIELGIEGFPYMTFWGPARQLPLICLEPWCNISDYTDSNQVWEQKEGNISLPPGEVFERTLKYTIGHSGGSA